MRRQTRYQPCDLGLMCLRLSGHNSMRQKMSRKLVTVFVVNYGLAPSLVLPNWARFAVYWAVSVWATLGYIGQIHIAH